MAVRAEEIKYAIDTFKQIDGLVKSNINDLKNVKSAVTIIIPLLKKMATNKSVDDAIYEKLVGLCCPDMLSKIISGNTGIISERPDCDNSCVFNCPDSSCIECWREYIENVIDNSGEVIDEISKISLRDE